MHLVSRFVVGFSLLLLLATLGCGSGNAGVTVSGTVTYNGKALPDGDILFAPAEGTAQEAHAKIAAGSYTLQVVPGKKIVRIIATREEGPKDPTMGMAPRKPYLPKKYNTESELKREVSSDASKNRLDFALEGPP